MQEILAGCRTFSSTGCTFLPMGLFIWCLLEDRKLALKVECFTPDGSTCPHSSGETSGQSKGISGLIPGCAQQISGDPLWGCTTSESTQPWSLGKGRGNKRDPCPRFPKCVQLYRGYKYCMSSLLIVLFQVTSVLGGALWEGCSVCPFMHKWIDEAFLKGCDMVQRIRKKP